MKKSRFTESEIVGILKEADAGLPVGDVKTRDPRSRIRQHIQGRRSGDQFCIYIQDFYVIPDLIRSDYTPRKGHLDELVRNFIQSRLTFRFVVFQTDDSDQIVRRLEREIQSGRHLNQRPIINFSGKNEQEYCSKRLFRSLESVRQEDNGQIYRAE